MVNEFLPYIIAGISTGAIYGLAGAGLLLTYKTSGIFNFATSSTGSTPKGRWAGSRPWC
jgi:branched-subunit amino acid ABC-type transport system permease component